MHDRSEPSSPRGVDRIDARCLPAADDWSSAGAETVQLDDAAPLASFAVITVRNDTRSPVQFDLRILPDVPRFLTFHQSRAKGGLSCASYGRGSTHLNSR
jgi:hypothetical protein